MNAAPKLDFFGIERLVSFCRNCGSKLPAKTGEVHEVQVDGHGPVFDSGIV